MDINFRQLSQNDFPQMHIWLNTDFVIQWFEKGGMTLDKIKDKYIPKITGEEPDKAYIIVIDSVDIGYIQTYAVSDFPDYNKYVETDENTAAVDLFIGHKDYIHKGFGVQIMKVFLQDYVFDDPKFDKCIIGPEPKNSSAIRMYEKAGFKWYKNIQLPTENEPEYLMKLLKIDFSYNYH